MADRQPIRLLVIDDDPPIQSLMTALFQRRGVNLDSALDGETALKKVRRCRYDAILLDLMLPGTNGFEVIRALKTLDPSLLGRTIVLTAASEATLRHFDDGVLVRRVIRKPFDVSDLVDEVLSCCPDDGGSDPDLLVTRAS